MRILLTTYGSRGDVEPMAALAAELKWLGAEAILCAPPDAEFVDVAARAGAPFAPAFAPVRPWVREQRRRGPVDLPRVAAEMVAGQFEAIGAAAEGCDAVIATGLLPSEAASLAVAERLGVPYRHVGFCPIFLPSPHHPPCAFPGQKLPPDEADNRALWRHNAQAISKLFGGAVDAHRASLGMAPLGAVRDRVFTDAPLLATDPVLGPWRPTQLRVAQTGAWILPDARPLPADLAAFLEAGAPPVYVGFGSMAMDGSPDVARTAIEAARALGRRVIVARGWAGLDPADEGDDVIVIGEINQQKLFPCVAAVVHHGGAGTTTAAARAGAPQAIAPQIADQPYWAGRIVELGVGAAIEGASPTLESMTAALGIALAPETCERARALAGAVRPDGAAVAARLLIEEIGAWTG